jgi:hypothetical protein
MLAEHPIDIWHQRLDAILKLAETLQNRYIVGKSDRETTIRELLFLLRKFGEQQFRFFEQGFNQAGNFKLQPHEDCGGKVDISPTHVFSVIVDQLANDLMVIQRAFEQRIVARLSPSREDKRPAPQKVFNTLDTADRLAWSAQKMLEPYLPANRFAGRTTVLCYLNKAPNVRIIPYAPVALIGIPMTALGYQTGDPQWARDFLTIPHEFAHHVYWYGRDFKNHLDQPVGEIPFLRVQLEQKVQGLCPTVQNWHEEIFTDVLGCMIGGPVVALSMIDLLVAERGNQLTIDDGTHPLPLLRPYIYTATLRQMNMDVIADTLEKYWSERLEKLGYPPPSGVAENCHFSITTNSSVGERAETRTVPFGDVMQVITAVMALLSLSPTQTTPRWSDGGTALDKLYTIFDNDLPRLLESDKLVRLFESGKLDTLHGWHSAGSTQTGQAQRQEAVPPPDDWQKWWEGLVRNYQLLDGGLPGSGELCAEQWVKLLRFGGWTTEGPGSPRGQGGL